MIRVLMTLICLWSSASLAATTCENSCDQQSPDGCWCDAACTTNGDCCDDYDTASHKDSSFVGPPVKIMDLLTDAKSHFDLVASYAESLGESGMD